MVAAGDIRAGAAFVELYAKDNMSGGLNQAEASTSKLGRAFGKGGKAGASFLKVLGAGTPALAGLGRVMGPLSWMTSNLIDSLSQAENKMQALGMIKMAGLSIGIMAAVGAIAYAIDLMAKEAQRAKEEIEEMDRAMKRSAAAARRPYKGPQTPEGEDAERTLKDMDTRKAELDKRRIELDKPGFWTSKANDEEWARVMQQLDSLGLQWAKTSQIIERERLKAQEAARKKSKDDYYWAQKDAADEQAVVMAEIEEKAMDERLKLITESSAAAMEETQKMVDADRLAWEQMADNAKGYAESLDSVGERIRQSIETPAQSAFRQLGELQTALTSGAIDYGTYAKAANKIMGGGDFTVTSTAGAMAAARGSDQNAPVNRTANATEETAAILGRIERNGGLTFQ